MHPSQKAIVWFNEVGKGDIALVGGKGANLGEMTNAHVPVPPGFIVTASAYYRFLKEANLVDKIREMLKPLNPHDSKQLQQIALQVQQVVLDASMPADLAESIKEAYNKMGCGLVAVRSSATAEDLPEASFAGQQSTFLNVQGESAVLVAVKGCWASLFKARAIFYRCQQGFDHMQVGIAVPVQRMVQSESSGVMFTIEPVTSDKTKIVIEAILGLGEALVSGGVTPDHYVIDKNDTKIQTKKIGKQEWMLVKSPEPKEGKSNIKKPLSETLQNRQKLSDEEIIILASLGKRLEQLYQFPQDIEWARENNKIYITQTRPVTTMKNIAPRFDPELGAANVLLSGTAASPGLATGKVKILRNATQIDQVLPGDILVAELTTPDFVPAMKRAVAIVTDRGGATTHAAIISRELGIPCVVGVEKGTTTLVNGQVITVDGGLGKVYEGDVTRHKVAAPAFITSNAKTKTKVYVNLAQPELAEKVAARNVDGVGLLRAEFIINQIGKHPRFMLSQDRSSEFIDRLYEGIKSFTSAFNPRPVVYRTTDFKTNEYRGLEGGQQYEDMEENPMLGYRGCSRYMKEPDLFELEIEAIKRVRADYKNLWVMVPFVRTVPGMAWVKDFMEAHGLTRSKDFKLWMMVEVPSNIFLMEKFIAVGIDGISIGSNDLTQLILGVDRDSQKLIRVFDERNEAVVMALEKAVTTAKKMGITSSICGQAPSRYPELTERLVGWGITSVSVSPDMIDVTREIIHKVEEKLGVVGKSA